MGWLDDLQVKAQQSISTAEQSIGSYLSQVTAPPPVKVGATPTGNLSAAQIAAGMRAGVQPVAPANATPAQIQNSVQASGFSLPGIGAVSMPMLAILAVAAYFVLSKARK